MSADVQSPATGAGAGAGAGAMPSASRGTPLAFARGAGAALGWPGVAPANLKRRFDDAELLAEDEDGDCDLGGGGGVGAASDTRMGTRTPSRATPGAGAPAAGARPSPARSRALFGASAAPVAWRSQQSTQVQAFPKRPRIGAGTPAGTPHGTQPSPFWAGIAAADAAGASTTAAAGSSPTGPASDTSKVGAGAGADAVGSGAGSSENGAAAGAGKETAGAAAGTVALRAPFGKLDANHSLRSRRPSFKPKPGVALFGARMKRSRPTDAGAEAGSGGGDATSATGPRFGPSAQGPNGKSRRQQLLDQRRHGRGAPAKRQRLRMNWTGEQADAAPPCACGQHTEVERLTARVAELEAEKATSEAHQAQVAEKLDKLAKQNAVLKRAFTASHKQAKAGAAEATKLREEATALMAEVNRLKMSNYALQVHLARVDGSMAGCGADVSVDSYFRDNRDVF